MKVFKFLTLLAIVASAQFAYSAIRWVYSDNLSIYGTLAIADTSRSFTFNEIFETDTGASYNGSNYINLDYKFIADSLFILDKYLNEKTNSYDTVYKSYRPGYAGFKLDWDGGITGFKLANYKGLVIAHKGPALNKKVTICFGYNTVCGSPTNFQTLGSFSGSTTWKLDTIIIPDSIVNVTDSQKTERNYYEMQVLITSTDGSVTSPKETFKIDDVCLITEIVNASVGAPVTNLGRKGYNISTTPDMKIAVEYSVQQSTPVTLSLYGADGRMIGETFTGLLQPGQKSLVWQPSKVKLSAKAYFLKMKTEGFSQTKRLIFER